MSFLHRSVKAVAATAVLTVAVTTPAHAREAAQVLRVYNDNIENLVMNNADGSCTRISGPAHLTSMLVDDNGRTGTSGVRAPDLLIVQQVRGTGQATAYADQLSAKFGYPAGTFKAIVAWDDPERWGGSHHCSQQSLGDLKKRQTNGIIYNTRTLKLAETSKYWSAGWLKPGTAYAGGAGCTLYKPPSNDAGAAYAHKWKRTSAIAARFTMRATGTPVFAASMHLPQENSRNACAGPGDTGLAGSGIRLGADARRLMNASTIRVVGIDANRTGIARTTLGGYGMTGYGAKPTLRTRKIDYLFVKGAVRPSPVDHTVNSTKSNHRALYAFITV
ncbi:hypothetical protein OUY22_06090 [Nonomuraea sp. MCN248]|uniref:Endonuclease/exonuclease/phosphatase family protein n=1 Tax=Nonomuraea corallina TaxID=2989783 RepID=A0ABT4S702_9ACTN|nr:hypothetical protein [Nonomuraea corallina]MDA0632983.1 hypothetical protein [Nonomuraea corallina]